MLTYIWFVPGFMGSALSVYQQTPGTALPGRKLYDLWGTYNALINAGSLPQLALPSNLPPGQTIQPTGLVDIAGGGYEQFGLYVVRNMPGAFVYSPWAYDWRQSARDLGAQLALQLQANNVKGNQNIVVAHSQGALVAWCAWAALVDAAQQSAMNRLITFGGALYGTQSSPNVFREDETGLDLLTMLLGLLNGTSFAGLQTGREAIYTANLARMLNVAGSWPGLYDLYPDSGMLDDPGDTNRGLLFNSTAWGAALVDPNFPLMQSEVTRVHQYVRQAKYLPPLTQVAHIVGNGHNTPYRVQPPAMSAQEAQRYAALARPAPNARQLRQLQLPAFSTTTQGDGRCTFAQQMFPGAYYQIVASQHAAMQNDPAVQQLVVQLLTQTLTPQPPTPPLQQPVPWTPPPALPNVPAFVFNNDPISTAAPAPPLPSDPGKLLSPTTGQFK